MAGETIVTIIGNLTSDPEFRFTSTGAAVVNFTIASTPRNYNRDTGQWEDGETLFLRASAWRDMAENISETLRKGMRVVATGRIKSNSYASKEGVQKQSFQLDIDDVGPSLKYVTASVVRKNNPSGDIANNKKNSSNIKMSDSWSKEPADNNSLQDGWDSIPNQEDPPF